MTYSGSQAQAGRGSTISIGSTPVLVGEVKSISLNRGEWQDVDVTNMESGLDAEIVTTIRNNGTVALKINRVSADTGQAAVEAAYQAATLAAWVLQLPKTAAQTTAGDKYVFSAYVVKSNITDDVKAAVEGDIELKISGAAPLTVGS
jgi:hypothetical protein